MSAFIISVANVALIAIAAVLLALSLLRGIVQVLPIGASPAPWIHGREIYGPLTDRRVEELIAEELYGQRLNVSRR